MNIHFKDIELFDNLMKNKIKQFVVGSHMYNLNNENSDIDYLTVYFDVNYGISWEHHQLQYKNNGIDYNFTSLQNFIRNILTGDSTINFELLYSDELAKSELSFLFDLKDHFHTYNIIISYLGMAKRDFKMLNRDSGEFRKFDKEIAKKMCHFLRGYLFAEMIFNHSFDLTMNTKLLEHSFNTDNEFLTKIKNLDIVFDEDLIKYVKFINEVKIVELRTLVNKSLEQKKISRYLNVDILNKIDTYVKNLNKKYSLHMESIDYKDLYLNVLENGLEY